MFVILGAFMLTNMHGIIVSVYRLRSYSYMLSRTGTTGLKLLHASCRFVKVQKGSNLIATYKSESLQFILISQIVAAYSWYLYIIYSYSFIVIRILLAEYLASHIYSYICAN